MGRADSDNSSDALATRDIFRNDDGGFTTLSVVVAMMLVLALLFTSVQVQWVTRESPSIQEVADAGALAAANVVAKFYIVARAADAVVLSLSLLSLTMFGIGAVLCIIPPLIPAGLKVISLARQVSSTRTSLAKVFGKALDSLQSAIPVVCALNSYSVIAQNSDGSSSYIGVAIPLPLTGETVEFPVDEEIESAEDSMEQDGNDVAESSEEASESDEAMQSSKHIAYMADCGNDPGYCMYQRASTLAAMSASANPYYASEDSWGFSVALRRAQAYYRARLSSEAPADDSLEEAVRSACRRAYYDYAVELLDRGYVNEGEGSFSAYFPLLPSNTLEMTATRLYTDALWPVSSDSLIHGAAACPAYGEAGGAGTGSLSQLDAGVYAECETCGFRASTLGKVGAASSSIDNGFEYHYRIVAEQAEIYEEQAQESEQAREAARESASSSFETLEEALEKISAKGMRYDPKPPGRNGCLCVVVDLETHEASEATGGLLFGFVSSQASFGPRIAVSAAALASDEAQEGANIISSMMDAVEENARDGGSGALVESGIDWLFDVWGGALAFYGEGVEGFAEGLRSFIDSIPLVGSTPLGSWAADAFLGTIDALGLSPVDLSTPKPVTVNTVHVLTASNETLGQALSLAKGLVGQERCPRS